MNDSNLKFDDDARERLISGVDKLANAVKITLGPMGKTVAICQLGSVPRITKDGVSVANSINLEDPYENAGASLVKEAAQRSAEVAGDGTTTSTVLAQAMIHQGQKLIAAGHPINDVVSGFRSACWSVKEQLNLTKVPINDQLSLQNVATISANGEEEIGKLIAEAITKVGIDGAISVQDAKGFETNLIIVDGTYLDKGYESPYFVTNSSTESCELDDPYILVINDTITSVASIKPVLEKVARTNSSLLIVCNDIGGEAMQTLVLNRVKGNMKICAIKSPEFASARTTTMQDVVSLCGGNVVTNTEEKQDDAFFERHLGRVKRAVITKTSTVLYGTKPDDSRDERILAAKNILQNPGSSESERAFAERRIRRLSNGIAVIQVGGTTEGEMKERKDRVDDALHAAKAAMREGIQAGGGIALARAKQVVLKKYTSNDSYGVAARAFLNSLESPLRQITENCCQSSDLVLQKALKLSTNIGYNGKTNKFGDMFLLGIVDPHLVVVSSLENAMSVSCNLLSIGCVVLDDDPKDGSLTFNGL